MTRSTYATPRQSTTAKITHTSARLITAWADRFHQGVLVRFRGKEIGHDAFTTEGAPSITTATIRKSTLLTLATDIAQGTLCTTAIIIRALFASDDYNHYQLACDELYRIGTDRELPTDSGWGYLFPDLSFGHVELIGDHSSFTAYTLSLPRYTAYLTDREEANTLATR